MRACVHACASMFSGEVNAPINYLLNVPLNATSLDFRANLFVPVEVHAPYGFCTTSGELFAFQLLSLVLANEYRLTRKTLFYVVVLHSISIFEKQKRFNVEIFVCTLHTGCCHVHFHLSFKR